MSDAGKFKQYSHRLVSAALYLRTVHYGVRKFTRRPHNLPGKLIVSLTSYPNRYRTLYATLVSLLNQSVQPDELVLWIARSQAAELPKRVARLQEHGLRISYCNDLRSYKKIIPSWAEDSNRFIVTADDDVFYEESWLDVLQRRYVDDKLIISHRVHKIALTESGYPAPYLNWKMNYDGRIADKLNFATGIGGILYPPNSLHPEVLNQGVFSTACPYADDVWLYWMARKNGFKIVSASPPKKFLTWPGSQMIGLHKINTSKNSSMNDVQIKALIDRYGWPI